MAAGLNAIFIEAPFQMQQGFVSGQIAVPQNHLDICTYDKTYPYVVAKASDTTDHVNDIGGLEEKKRGVDTFIVFELIGLGVFSVLLMILFIFYFTRFASTKQTDHVTSESVCNLESDEHEEIQRATSCDELIVSK